MIKFTFKAFLEVVEFGSKNIEIGVICLLISGLEMFFVEIIDVFVKNIEDEKVEFDKVKKEKVRVVAEVVVVVAIL